MSLFPDKQKRRGVRSGFLASVLFPAAIMVSACGLVDLRPVTVVTVPGMPYATLPSLDDSLAVSFPVEPDRLDAERAFSVRTQDGTVEGDYFWSETGFSWKPVGGWNAGVRYRMIVTGRIGMIDGRAAMPEIDIPFYVSRASGRPAILSFEPASGTQTDTSGDGQVLVRVEFSEPMDQRSVEYAFSIRPSVDCGYEWNDASTGFAVMSRERLQPCQTYRWEIGAGARSRDRCPLVRSGEGVFRTCVDSIPPTVERVYPAVLSEGTWVDAASSLDGIDQGQSIAILFSETIDPDSVRGGVRIVPGIPGDAQVVSPRLVVFTPQRNWPPEQPLSLVVSADVADESGIRMGDEYRRDFIPSLPYLRLLGIDSGSGEALDTPCNGNSLAVTVGSQPEGKLCLELRFSAVFDSAAKTNAVESMSLSSFFPGSLPAPRLKNVAWVAGDTVAMTWEGLWQSTADVTGLYRLLVPGGQSGIFAAQGLKLREDVVVYLEAKR